MSPAVVSTVLSAFFVLLLPALHAAPSTGNASPTGREVYISIGEPAGDKGFYVGPYDRSRFDVVVEQFNPLSTAGVVKGFHFCPHILYCSGGARPRAGGVASLRKKFAPPPVAHKRDPVVVEEVPASIIDDNQKDSDVIGLPPNPFSSYHPAYWHDWSAWSACVNGTRTRTRQCSRPGACTGINLQAQMCFDTVEHPIPFAKDPWMVEKEISRHDVERP